jgi:hypothetical protein
MGGDGPDVVGGCGRGDSVLLRLNRGSDASDEEAQAGPSDEGNGHQAARTT